MPRLFRKRISGAVMLEDVAELVLHLVQRRGEDVVEDAALLVAEERLERVGDVAEVAVEQPDGLRQVAVLEGGAGLGDQGLIGLRLLQRGHARVEVVIPEVEDAEDEALPSCRSARR